MDDAHLLPRQMCRLVRVFYYYYYYYYYYRCVGVWGEGMQVVYVICGKDD